MVFKLVRIDTEEPCKIHLPLGKHMIGRGKLLNCDDKRVSRNHGELDITEDSFTIKALHSNPCFYIKKGTEETEILKQSSVINLCNGDKFGLLPDSYWYEILHSTSLDIDRSSEVENQQVVSENNTEEQTQMGDADEMMLNNATRPESPSLTQRSESPSLILRVESPLIERSVSPSVIQRAGSPSLIQSDQSPSVIQRLESPLWTHGGGSPSLIQSTTENQSTQDNAAAEAPKTPGKRSHSSEVTDEAKKVKTEPVDEETKPADVKTEPVDVKQEPQDVKPGPSNDQVGSSSTDGSGKADPPPQLTGRERCMYGANCYRKNPQHKVKFSHPSDADWGAGERPACPWGAVCRRRDARHWRDHLHPPAARRPPAAAPGMEDDTAAQDLIVAGKRARKPIPREKISSESENEDPFETDESDEWVPDGQQISSVFAENYDRIVFD